MGGGPNLNYHRCNCPPACYEEVSYGTRGKACLRYGCTPACVACSYSRPQNIPACFESMPGFPEDCVSPHFIPSCKKFCRYAQTN